MEKFLKHLREKGYRIIGDKAVLGGSSFKIRSGNIDTAMGKQKSYWLELTGITQEAICPPVF